MRKNNFTRNIRFRLRQLKNLIVTLRKKGIFTFLAFVALSFSIWYVLAINENQAKTIRVPIEYYNQPEGTTLLQNAPTYIEVEIEDIGQNMLEYKYKGIPPLKIDLANYNNGQDAFIITRNSLTSQLSTQFKNSTKITSFHPDSISIRYTPEPGKRVPVVINGDITAAQNRGYNDDATCTPDSVTIYALAHTLKQTHCIYTEEIDCTNLTDTTSITAKLIPVKGALITPQKVKINIPIEHYNTVTLNVPITIEKTPIQYNVTTYPQTVEITCLVPGSKSVTAQDFVIGDSFDKIKPSKEMPIKILKSPSFVDINLIRFSGGQDTYECRIEKIVDE